MRALKPYLIRSVYEWIVDNELSPYLLVSAADERSSLPSQYIEDGKIILNIRPEAVRGLSLGNDWVSFNARFGGVSTQIEFPVTAVLAIYAKENGKGMVFDDEDGKSGPRAPPSIDGKQSKPALKIVK